MIAYAHFQQVFVSKRAQGIADWLIDTYEIQDGYGLAYHLKVSRQMSNHDAVRIWVQRKLQTRPREFQTLGDLRSCFVSCLPSNHLY